MRTTLALPSTRGRKRRSCRKTRSGPAGSLVPAMRGVQQGSSHVHMCAVRRAPTTAGLAERKSRVSSIGACLAVWLTCWPFSLRELSCATTTPFKLKGQQVSACACSARRAYSTSVGTSLVSAVFFLQWLIYPLLVGCHVCCSAASGATNPLMTYKSLLDSFL